MNIEIRKVANGYLVLPMDRHENYGRCLDPTRVYVFRDYAAMIDKLQEILERPE